LRCPKLSKNSDHNRLLAFVLELNKTLCFLAARSYFYSHHLLFAMLLQYASDLHLEFPENKAFIKDNPLTPKGDVLVLAGDVMPFILIDKHKNFFDYLADNFKHTYWVPGNHEYYHFDAAKKNGAFCESIRTNISLINNSSVRLDGVQLVFSTLWSKLSESNWWEIVISNCMLMGYPTLKMSWE
jgi:hypothetical protein